MITNALNLLDLYASYDSHSVLYTLSYMKPTVPVSSNLTQGPNLVGTLLCVSHDRAFIDGVATSIIIMVNFNLADILMEFTISPVF